MWKNEDTIPDSQHKHLTLIQASVAGREGGSKAAFWLMPKNLGCFCSALQIQEENWVHITYWVHSLRRDRALDEWSDWSDSRRTEAAEPTHSPTLPLLMPQPIGGRFQSCSEAEMIRERVCIGTSHWPFVKRFSLHTRLWLAKVESGGWDALLLLQGDIFGSSFHDRESIRHPPCH